MLRAILEHSMAGEEADDQVILDGDLLVLTISDLRRNATENLVKLFVCWIVRAVIYVLEHYFILLKAFLK